MPLYSRGKWGEAVLGQSSFHFLQQNNWLYHWWLTYAIQLDHEEIISNLAVNALISILQNVPGQTPLKRTLLKSFHFTQRQSLTLTLDEDGHGLQEPYKTHRQDVLPLWLWGMRGEKAASQLWVLSASTGSSHQSTLPGGSCLPATPQVAASLSQSSPENPVVPWTLKRLCPTNTSDFMCISASNCIQMILFAATWEIRFPK